MSSVKVSVNGEDYPCRQTMGAALRYKRETGEDISKLGADNIAGLCTYLWCCVVSSCKADGVDFGLSLEDFADNLDVSDVTAWVATLTAGAAGPEEKKI